MDCYQGAIALKPGHAQAHCNLGLLHLNQGEPLSARAGYDRAISSNPEHAKAHVGRAMVDLMLGDWSRGWNEYEWRWRIKNVPPPLPGIASPSWSGEPLCGARIYWSMNRGSAMRCNSCATRRSWPTSGDAYCFESARPAAHPGDRSGRGIGVDLR